VAGIEAELPKSTGKKSPEAATALELAVTGLGEISKNFGSSVIL
jgi:hypothetical protein